ncbi:MAG: ATP-dependent DNA helicase [Nanoarchaeota archaeon]|nr:ATP-dependent DNA helicase [Nanoarchaeota archaeon]
MIHFPHDILRQGQEEMISAVKDVLNTKGSLLIHAPTGIGKTAAALAPIVPALKAGETIFFLTSRHTQHRIVIETLRQMKARHGTGIKVADIIGKRWMCGQPHADELMSRDFAEYCRALREQGSCEYYTNTKTKHRPSVEANLLASGISAQIPTTREIFDESVSRKLCPYEMACLLAKDAQVIIADYYYIFDEDIRNNFFNRISKKLEDCILVIDEAHNLSSRVRELMSSRLTKFMLARAMKEASNYEEKGSKVILKELDSNLDRIGRDVKTERYAAMEELKMDTDNAVDEFEEAATRIRLKQKRSFIGGISGFLSAWQGPDEGFTRIISRELNNLMLSYRCLDPALATREILNSCHSAILMSATLTPFEMHSDILGVEGKSMALESPFPKENRLNLIVPETTTKFSKRSDEQYMRIAEICSDIISTVPGNVIIFFPSYRVMHNVYPFLKSDVPMLVEKQGKPEREKLLREFSSGHSVLLAVSAGSFGEGIDLKDNIVKAIIIVGLPLHVPNLETKALINYYDKKFGKGWSYGYTLPAMIKTIQNSGRCIRSETDKGAIIFLDERYTWPNYFCCFPPEWQLKISRDYKDKLNEFFGR